MGIFIEGGHNNVRRYIEQVGVNCNDPHNSGMVGIGGGINISDIGGQA